MGDAIQTRAAVADESILMLIVFCFCCSLNSKLISNQLIGHGYLLSQLLFKVCCS